MLPCLSVLNSNLPAAISLTADSKSGVTVPALGFGIKPLGPRTLAILPKCLIIVGVATTVSKSRATLPFAISSINSSQPAIAAPAASTAFVSPSVITQIFEVLPEPFGREQVVLII